MVEMSERSRHMPNELSGGQKQRVAIARAMANDPAIILADEPTGALDSNTGRLVMDIFHELHEKQGKTIVLITHNNELAKRRNASSPSTTAASSGNATSAWSGRGGCMNLFENISLAIAGLVSNKMRALLTMLGIIIGIGSVIAITSVGEAMTGMVSSSMESMGVSNVAIKSRPAITPVLIPILRTTSSPTK